MHGFPTIIVLSLVSRFEWNKFRKGNNPYQQVGKASQHTNNMHNPLSLLSTMSAVYLKGTTVTISIDRQH